MKTIASLEKQLEVLRAELSVCTDPEEKGNLDEQIDSIQDDIDELEQEEIDARHYEEMTGTTPQDIYNDANAYAIRQSEMIDKFRNEY